MSEQFSWQPDGIFLLSGWGCPSQWLQPLQKNLQYDFSCSCDLIDLPGYASSDDSEWDVEAWQVRVLERLKGYHQPLLIGWSYGGMLAVGLAYQLMRHAGDGCKVVVLGARPRFVDDQWTVFDHKAAASFQNRVAHSAVKGLSYFIALAGRGEPKRQIQSLKHDIQTTAASKAALVHSLEHLYRLDVEDAWQFMEQRQALFPVYFQEDALIRVPNNMGQLAVEGASHLAPVTNSSLVSSEIKRLFIG